MASVEARVVSYRAGTSSGSAINGRKGCGAWGATGVEERLCDSGDVECEDGLLRGETGGLIWRCIDKLLAQGLVREVEVYFSPY
jgi:hypothetical protein